MGVTVRLPIPLRSLADGRTSVVVHGSNVLEVLRALEEGYPGIGPMLFDESGEVRRHINIYVNDAVIRFLRKLRPPRVEGDELTIIPAISGGRSQS